MKNIFSDVFGTLKYNFRSIFIFELTYRIVCVVLFGRLAKRMLKIVIDNTGYSYLTLKNAAAVMTSPVTYPILICMILLAVLAAGFEMSVLYTGFRAAAAGKNMRISTMLAGGGRRFLKMCTPGSAPALMTGVLSYFIFELIPIFDFVKISRRAYDVTKYISNYRLFRAVAVFLIVLAAGFTFYNMFVFCFRIFGNERDKKLYESARSFWKGREFKTGFVYAVWFAVYILCYTVIYFISIFITTCLVVLFAKEKYEIMLVGEIGRNIKIVLIYFASVFSVLLGSGITVGVYYHYRPEQRENIITSGSYANFPWLKRTFTVVGLAVAVGTVFSIVDVIRNGNLSGMSGMVIMSHRGDSKEAPENTLPAIRLAIEKNADYVEIDVRETKDGQIVVMHDGSVFRTTGVKENVSDMTYDEIRRLDAGSRFSREYAGTRVPLLSEVLEECKSKINVNIEIKVSKDDSPYFIKNITHMIENMNMEEQCIFQSSNYDCLKEVKSYNIELRTGLIIPGGFGNYFKDDNVDFFSVNSAYLRADKVDSAHENGKRLYAWTVNSYDELMRMKSIGVDGVITDRPLYAREVIDGNEGTQSLVSYIKMLIN